MKPQLDHEKLEVYQHAVQFTAWTEEFIALLPARAVRDQLDRASTSIPLNIAEGNGKFSIRDRCRYLEIARGSAVECAACLDVAVAKKLVPAGAVTEGKERLLRIVSMVTGLIMSLNNRVSEEPAGYGTTEQEHEQEKEQE